MKHWIYKAKRWLVHKLGGYMHDECIVNPNKVKHLQLIERYSMDCMEYHREYSVGTMRAEVVKSSQKALYRT